MSWPARTLKGPPLAADKLADVNLLGEGLITTLLQSSTDNAEEHDVTRLSTVSIEPDFEALTEPASVKVVT